MGLEAWHCAAARLTPECVGVLAPCPAVLRAAVLPSCPGTAGLLSPGRQHARPPAPAARAEQATGFGVSGCLVPLNSPKPQRKLGEVVFFFSRRKGSFALPLPWARGSCGTEQRILVLRGQPRASGCCTAAETPSSSEVREASDHQPSMQHRGCVQPCCDNFSLNSPGLLDTFGLCWFCFF